MSFTAQGMPTHSELVLPTLRAVSALGGSAQAGEIADQVAEAFPGAEDLLRVAYPNRPAQSVFLDRAAWARSTAKLIGALEQPARGMYLTTALGEELLLIPESAAFDKVRELEREYARAQREKKRAHATTDPSATLTNDHEDEPSADVVAEADSEDDQTASWKPQLLQRLHALPPTGFEKFVIYLLKRHGLQLSHVGGSSDEGIDAIGTAPLSPVLSSRVAVQVKRYAHRMENRLGARQLLCSNVMHRRRVRSEQS